MKCLLYEVKVRSSLLDNRTNVLYNNFCNFTSIYFGNCGIEMSKRTLYQNKGISYLLFEPHSNLLGFKPRIPVGYGKTDPFEPFFK